MNKTPIYINADRLIDWIDAGHYRSPTEPVFSEQEIVHIIKQQPVCLVEPIIYAGWKEIRGMAPPEDHGKHKCSNCGQLALSRESPGFSRGELSTAITRRYTRRKTKKYL